MSTFEVDADPQPPSPPADADANPLADDTVVSRLSLDGNSSPRSSNFSEDLDATTPSPVSQRNKIASHHAALMSEPGRILDLAERKWLQDKWYKLDTSGDGYLDLAETTSLLRDLKKKMTDPEVKAAFEEMDVDGCGNVDFDEFYLWFARQDADQFAHLMLRGAHRQFVKGIVGIGLGMFLPLAAITLLAGPSPLDEPADFFTVVGFVVVAIALLGGAVFVDAFAPVMQAQAKADALSTTISKRK